MEGNPRDPSHLRVRKLWVRVVVRPYYCPDVLHIMSKLGLSGSGQ
jgi:hypothetical protein